MHESSEAFVDTKTKEVFYLIFTDKSKNLMVLICNLFVIFYVSHTGNVCFPIGKRTFPHWKTYVSASVDIKYNKRLFYHCLCLFKFVTNLDKRGLYTLLYTAGIRTCIFLGP